MGASHETKTLEALRLDLQTSLDAAKTQEKRNELGQFSTPPDLAAEIVCAALKLAPNGGDLRFLEPGFNTGTFFSALLRSAGRRRIAAAKGVEIDPHYATPARDLWVDTRLQVCIGDFTQMQPPGEESEKFNLLVCNPPYSRHHHLSKDQKVRLQRALLNTSSARLSGLAGLHCYFLLLAHAWMAENGVAAWLIPSEFMEVNYGQRVREYLLNRVILERVHLFDSSDIQFGDALVSSAVLFFRKARPPADHEVEFTLGGSVLRPSVAHSVPASILHERVRWPRPPFDLDEKPETGYTLADFFTIKRGLATGDNSFFILTREQIEQHNLPWKFFKPILPSSRYIKGDEVAADEHGLPRVSRVLFLLDCPLDENELRDRYSSLWSYLQEGKKKTVEQRYLCRHRSPWYSQEQRPPAEFLCTYMGRGGRDTGKPFRFILNHSRATAPNVYLLLYPTALLARALHADATLFRKLWEILSTMKPASVLDQARTYGGGLHKWEPRELGRVPANRIASLLGLSSKPATDQLQLFGGRRKAAVS